MIVLSILAKPNQPSSARRLATRTRLTSSNSATPTSTKRNERMKTPLRTTPRTSARLSKQ